MTTSLDFAKRSAAVKVRAIVARETAMTTTNAWESISCASSALTVRRILRYQDAWATQWQVSMRRKMNLSASHMFVLGELTRVVRLFR